MRVQVHLVAAALLLPTGAPAQASSAPPPCAASEQALRAVAHGVWAGYNRRDVAALDTLLDDQLLFVPLSGAAQSKAQFLAPFRAPEGGIKFESAEQARDVRTLFMGNAALMSFSRVWKFTHKPSAVSFGGT